MKVAKGDKVALLCVKNVYGVDYMCYYGTLLNVRELYGKRVYRIRAVKLDLLTSILDMKGKELDLWSEVFTLKPWNEETKAHLKDVKTACLVLSTALHKFAPKRVPKSAKNQ